MKSIKILFREVTHMLAEMIRNGGVAYISTDAKLCYACYSDGLISDKDGALPCDYVLVTGIESGDPKATLIDEANPEHLKSIYEARDYEFEITSMGHTGEIMPSFPEFKANANMDELFNELFMNNHTDEVISQQLKAAYEGEIESVVCDIDIEPEVIGDNVPQCISKKICDEQPMKMSFEDRIDQTIELAESRFN